MPTLSTELRNRLEKTVIAARNLGEKAAKAALEGLAANRAKPDSHMTDEQKRLRNHLRARARQLGDKKHANDEHEIRHLAHECAYEHWHRMLFARFLAENHLLIEPEAGVAVSLDECKELAKEEKTDLWTLAGRYAQKMLPQIFRPDDPLLQVSLAKEHQLKLEALVNDLPQATFTATDSIGWCYQFWQTERKDKVNAAGNKIGADELPAVTQLFTEDYMVDFLLDNTLGAWWAGKFLAAHPKIAENARSEDELRRAVALPGAEWTYLRFIKKGGKWTPAAGTFDSWPQTAKELKCLDPCCGSGHFVVAIFERLAAMRMVEEKLREKEAVSSVIRDNLFGLEIDLRCTQLAAFNLALAAWRRVGHCPLPDLHIACSGTGVTARKEEWLTLAGETDKLRAGMERLHHLFQRAALLGSLINPHSLAGDLLVAQFHELRPLLDRALQLENTDDAHELAVTAKGVAEATDILRRQYTLVATNVPFLGMNRQDPLLFDFFKNNYASAKADLATVFISRCLQFCGAGGSIGVVAPQIWLFLGSYKGFRTELLKQVQWNLIARLGPGAFETIGGEVVNVGLFALTSTLPNADHRLHGLDVNECNGGPEKAAFLKNGDIIDLPQADQLRNPDARVTLERTSDLPLLLKYADSYWGIGSGDIPRFAQQFWEIPQMNRDWKPLHVTSPTTTEYIGREQILDWRTSRLELCEFDYERELWLANRWNRGSEGWGKQGVAISQMGGLAATLFTGEVYQNGVAAIIPKNPANLPAIWCFCSSEEFSREVRKIDKKLSVTNLTLIKVPFDLARWSKVAKDRYPHGLPKPRSSHPTQWLFDGHPKGSDHPLHVAVARLLGYQWPRQSGSEFHDCPALKPDGLEKLADRDGIACIPSVRGEEPAAERLRKLLAAAYGGEWTPELERKLIKDSGSEAEDLDEWLRNDFFAQHCDLLHHRPFVWHIWDGRKRDGFHALVNYHKLADGAKGKKVLESLTHSYLNDWIGRQRDGVKRGEDGAEERLGAAQELKQRLEAIIAGEPPFDIFVRWKPLARQPIGWEPDINDGVRLNIRPFLASDLPGGKKGAGILRSKPNVKWDKDRGKEPHRPKDEFPWFWSGSTFTGDRLNDVHLTNDQKAKAKKEASS